MNKIVYINLSEGTITQELFEIKKGMEYGRGLAGYLMEQSVPGDIGRFDDENAIILVPGLCSGTLVPSTGRITIAAKKEKGEGIQFANLGGAFSQKLASLDIAAVVIKGTNNSKNPVSLIFSKDNIYIEKNFALKGLEVSKTIEVIRKNVGEDSAIIGVGPAGEHMLPLASLFSTYTEGKMPEYHCSRGAMGDIFGAKGIKALVVKNKNFFNSSVFDKEGISKASKVIAKTIVDHPICGDALPGYGSITLMKLLKQGKNIKVSAKDNKIDCNKIKTKGLYNNINKTCSPICVIGCLNRHVKEGNNFYSSPAESEVYAALKEAFNIDDKKFASDTNKKAFELGLDSVEFVFTCALYFKAISKSADEKDIMDILEEINKLSVLGRLIGSKTQGVYSFYKDRKELKELVTKPSVHEESKFDIFIKSKPKIFSNISDLDYLYSMIITLGNFGICLFSAFALIEKEDTLSVLSNIFYCKTGVKIEPFEIVIYSLECLEREKVYETKAKLQDAQKTIPEFVKVLYRYFNKNEMC